ncbi:hypothetical protein JTB14_016380 [Gonioctena quinquepunctata]|nr:hypothetical protein JTB14_016380 [Gonioctena quinquepunctata]
MKIAFTVKELTMYNILSSCPRWTVHRLTVNTYLGVVLGEDEIISNMTKSNENWKEIHYFTTTVLKTEGERGARKTRSIDKLGEKTAAISDDISQR